MIRNLCCIIQDILPLYCDNVCSSDSKKIIEEHLQECETCSAMLRQMKYVYEVDAQEIIQNKEESAILEKISHQWKHSITKALLIGIVTTMILLSSVYAVYEFLFVKNTAMVAPEKVVVDFYKDPQLIGEHIIIRMQPVDGYMSGTMNTYVDKDGNLYISILRSVVKEKIPEGEKEEMIYGFDQSEKKYTAVYYGNPQNNKLLWQMGETIQDAPLDVYD